MARLNMLHVKLDDPMGPACAATLLPQSRDRCLRLVSDQGSHANLNTIFSRLGTLQLGPRPQGWGPGYGSSPVTDRQTALAGAKEPPLKTACRRGSFDGKSKLLLGGRR